MLLRRHCSKRACCGLGLNKARHRRTPRRSAASGARECAHKGFLNSLSSSFLMAYFMSSLLGKSTMPVVPLPSRKVCMPRFHQPARAAPAVHRHTRRQAHAQQVAHLECVRAECQLQDT